jgi:DNA modification methylase
MSEWRLENCDALDLMASLEAGSVDALITDPPYGTTALEWDKPIDWPRFWTEARRVCKPTAPMVLFSAQPFTTDLINSNRTAYRYDVVWRKTLPTRVLDANRMPLRVHELILVFCDNGYGTYNPQLTNGGAAYNITRSENGGDHYQGSLAGTYVNHGTRHPTSVLEFSNKAGELATDRHPTQKPVDLMAWLVKSYTNAGGLVLDPFAGSGSTGAACLLTGRGFVGSELSPEYHAKATERLEGIACQPGLFEEVAA